MTLQRALSGLMGEEARLQWVGERLVGKLVNTENADTLRNFSYRRKKGDRVSVY